MSEEERDAHYRLEARWRAEIQHYVDARFDALLMIMASEHSADVARTTLGNVIARELTTEALAHESPNASRLRSLLHRASRRPKLREPPD